MAWPSHSVSRRSVAKSLSRMRDMAAGPPLAFAHAMVRTRPSASLRAFMKLQDSKAPGMAAARDLETELHPLVLRRAVPNHRASRLNTDAYGLRCCSVDGQLIDLDEFLVSSLPKGVLNGNSIAFGMGASEDATTIASQLNMRMHNKARWYSLALLGAPTLCQERMSADLYGPLEADFYVTVSGCIDTFLAALGRSGEAGTAPFFGEATHNRLLNRQGAGSGVSDPGDLPNLLNIMSREVALIARRWSGSRKLFCLQPIYPWTRKRPTADEKRLLETFYAMPNDFALGYSPDRLATWGEKVSQHLAETCAGCGVDFIDLNVDPAIAGSEWIFLDPVHLTDKGLARIAERIDAWIADGGQ